jgi:hypothetical protein
MPAKESSQITLQDEHSLDSQTIASRRILERHRDDRHACVM